jgi:hypothetical protein
MREAGPLFLVSMVLVVVANVLYHWGQKSVPAEVPLLASLAQTFATALLLTLLALPWLAGPLPAAGVAVWLNWKSVAVGLAIFGVEIGFLLAYRAGWPLNTAALTAGALLAVVLVPFGALLFGEAWTLAKSAGLLLCLAGLWLLNRS